LNRRWSDKGERRNHLDLYGGIVVVLERLGDFIVTIGENADVVGPRQNVGNENARREEGRHLSRAQVRRQEPCVAPQLSLKHRQRRVLGGDRRIRGQIKPRTDVARGGVRGLIPDVFHAEREQQDGVAGNDG